MKLLFDTNILIDALNDIPAGVAELRGTQERFISVVACIEVLAGCPTTEAEDLAHQLLAGMTTMELTAEVADEAVRIRRQKGMKLPDAIILATARVHGLTLSTRNTKDFPEDDPAIRVPYRL